MQRDACAELIFPLETLGKFQEHQVCLSILEQDDGALLHHLTNIIAIFSPKYLQHSIHVQYMNRGDTECTHLTS